MPRNLRHHGAALIVLMVMAPPVAAAQSDPPRLVRWMEMAGCWEIHGRELSSRGDMFWQTGIGHIRVDQANRVLLGRRLMVREAIGEYASMNRNRSFTEAYFEVSPGRIAAEEADVPDPARTRRTVLLSPAGDAIFSTFLSSGGATGAGTVNTIMWRIVSANRIESETRARDPHGTYWSDYAQSWTRLPTSDPRCKDGS